MSKLDVRERAENLLEGDALSGYADIAKAYAILDLADAIREAGEGVTTALSDIEASVTQLAVAVQNLD